MLASSIKEQLSLVYIGISKSEIQNLVSLSETMVLGIPWPSSFIGRRGSQCS